MSETTPPPVKSSTEYFNSSRLRVIGLITAGTLAVGALGGIAGVAFDPEPVGEDGVVQPVGTDGSRFSGTGSPGNSSPHAAQYGAVTSRAVPGADDTPSPVGSLSPSSDGSSESPAEEPTGDPGPPDGGGSGDGEHVTIEATDVQIFVPEGWELGFQNENQVFQRDDTGSFSFAFSLVDDASVASSDIISQNLENMLPPENYTQLQTSDVVPLETFGSLVSLSGIEYEALWVDNQGSISIRGQIYVGVRQDGTVLGILIEHLPAEDFDAAFEEMVPILDNSFGPFAGLG